MHAVLVTSELDAGLEFAVEFGDTPISEIIPPDFTRSCPRCDVYLSTDDVEVRTEATAGDLLLLQSVGAPPPALPSLQSILADPGNEIVPANVPPREEAPSNRFALLGVEFEQTIIELGDSSRLQRCFRCLPSACTFGCKGSPSTN